MRLVSESLPVSDDEHNGDCHHRDRCSSEQKPRPQRPLGLCGLRHRDSGLRWLAGNKLRRGSGLCRLRHRGSSQRRLAGSGQRQRRSTHREDHCLDRANRGMFHLYPVLHGCWVRTALDREIRFKHGRPGMLYHEPWNDSRCPFDDFGGI